MDDPSKPYINYNHLMPKRPPKAQPVPAAKEPEEECKNCIKKCKHPKREWKNYGCWCGEHLAPAQPYEKDIPNDKSKYGDFLKEKGLPQPYDPVDECCMIHDLELGAARKENPNLAWNSGSMKIAGINARMSACLKSNQYNKANGKWGGTFAGYSGTIFGGLAVGNTVGAGYNAVTGSGASANVGSDAGFGSVGAGSAASGASGSW